MSHSRIDTVRERLWLLAHDDRHELQPLLHAGALEIGLMAATLIDLLLRDRIVLAADSLRPAIAMGRRSALAEPEPISAGVLKAITDETPLLAQVLRAARADLPGGEHHPYVRLYQRTQAALIANGIVVEHKRRLRPSRFTLADPGGIGWIKGQVNHRLVYHNRRGDPSTDSLCALVRALNLHSTMVTPYEPSEAAEILHQITEQIPASAGQGSPLAVVPHLAHGVRVAVGDLATAVF